MKIEINTAKILDAVDDIKDDPVIGILERNSSANLTRNILLYNKYPDYMQNRELLVDSMANIYLSLMLIQGNYGISSTEIESIINSILSKGK